MLFDKLSERDKITIQGYIDDFGANPGSQVYRNHASLNHLLRFWEGAKEEWLYQLMGNEFILEKKISYNRPLEKLRQELERAMSQHNNGPMYEFHRNYLEKMKKIFNPNNYYFLCDDNYYAYTALVNFDNLATNSINYPLNPTVLDFGDGNKLKVENTSKPMRALGKIAKFIGEEESFEKFRLEHSRILNQKRLEGTLCLSIHPMDYMTMSDNASNWHSCMSWAKTGGYRMGTVEMMNSNCVIVAYLKSENSTWYDWNDKHWRCLFLATPDIITSVKGYPYYSEDLCKICVDWIKELGTKNLSWDFNETIEIEEDEVFEYVDKNFYHLETETAIMYNDFGSTPHFAALPNVIRESSSYSDPYMLTLNYSGITECMCCGCEIDYSYDESYLYCENCCSNADEDESCECEHCGQWWSYDEMYDVDGDMVCPDCVDDIAAESALDFCYHYKNDLIQVYLASKNDDPNVDNDEYCYLPKACRDTYDLSIYRSDKVSISHPHCSKDGIYYFNEGEITENGMSAWFHIYSWNQPTYFRNNE